MFRPLASHTGLRALSCENVAIDLMVTCCNAGIEYSTILYDLALVKAKGHDKLKPKLYWF